MHECVTLKSLNPLVTSSEKMRAHVLDRSDSEATLRIAEPLLVGSTVQVRFKDRIALGDVRFCSAVNGEYDVCIHFHDVLTVGKPA